MNRTGATPAAGDHPDSSSTSSSVQLLGLPADARVLILNCDDLGTHPSINATVSAAVQQGVASSTSLVVPCPAAGEALRLLRAAPEVPFGIHLTLTRDGPAHRWAPISAPAQVPSLVDEHGLAARVWLDPARSAARRRGLPVLDHEFVDSFALDVDGEAERYLQLLRELPAGLSEWAVHPAVGPETAAEADLGWAVRRSDHDFLLSPRAREVLEEEGIVVLDHRPSREVWNAAGATREQ
ncbi:ChbG/HpnK family deacetylase [Paenibacillus sp. TRM 82003]|uniref:ChbG/HpnK family deacetylase n=1 Tax=Kineococcus sp. TRM81007 TaxID=2925831 RepID=UPI001F55AEBB|nr:ChbG/HpnK family deacetylase [Kineococcus sp. TRM81007]MCI2238031.1 ChbG/HpnK family deacetylase [Kineococcus sp. TRM81007]MCI3926046.1 ChbG/HpnK family deacetylase [Paenibacillus sp. TRM 82003]